jgi:hypothetical protein
MTVRLIHAVLALRVVRLRTSEIANCELIPSRGTASPVTNHYFLFFFFPFFPSSPPSLSFSTSVMVGSAVLGFPRIGASMPSL